MGTNIMANQVKTPIQNYFEKKIVTSPCGYTGRLRPSTRCSVHDKSLSVTCNRSTYSSFLHQYNCCNSTDEPCYLELG